MTGFPPRMVCDPSGKPRWTTEESINSGAECWSAWGAIGFHPFSSAGNNNTGTFLTLIVGGPNVNLTGDVVYTNDNFYQPYQKQNPSDFYLSITKLSNKPPVDVFTRWPSPADAFTLWPSLADYENFTTTVDGYYPPDNAPEGLSDMVNNNIRTDNDLIANGYDVACCNNADGCYPNSVAAHVQWSNTTLQHFDCPDANVSWVPPKDAHG